MNLKNVSQKEWIPLLVPSMPRPEEIIPWIEKIHNSGHYSNFGPLVKSLEEIFANKFSVSNEEVTTVGNATLGIELVLQSLNLPKKAKVLIPAFTFVATATAAIRAGLTPVIADVDEECWLLTPEIAYQVVNKEHIDAVLTVAAFGMPHDMHAWEKFERDTDIPVIVDAAAAYGSQWLNGAQGTLIFSLHATKSLAAGEGGLVISTRPGLAESVRRLSNFGICMNPGENFRVGELSACGSNAKMSEYHAAVALASLETWESKAEKRRELREEMISMLQENSSVNLLWQKDSFCGTVVAPTLLCTCLPDEMTREKIEKACYSGKIMTRRWYQPIISDMPIINNISKVLPITKARELSRNLIGLPFFIGIQDFEKMKIINIFKYLE